MQPKPVINRALLDAELLDAKSQRDSAQQSLNAANVQMQQSQQTAQQAQAMLLTASGAIQQLEALIKKLEIADAPSTPDP